MSPKRTKRSNAPTSDVGHTASKRKTIPADKLGLSLTISDEALKEFDQIQEETINIAENVRNFSWR